MSRSQTRKEKATYETLAEVLRAKSAIVRTMGSRFRVLRPYKDDSGWHLTKMSRGQLKRAT
jgi:hypothetical protein